MYKLLFYGETWTVQSATYLARKQRKTGQKLTPAQPPQSAPQWWLTPASKSCWNWRLLASCSSQADLGPVRRVVKARHPNHVERETSS